MATTDQVLRKWPKGLAGVAFRIVIATLPFAFAIMRRFAPNFGFGSTRFVTRYDDVREAFAADHALMVPYKKNLDQMTGGQPCFVGMADTAEYRHDLQQLRNLLMIV